MGLQTSCRVRSQATTQGAVWKDASAIGRNLPRLGPAERVPDSGGTPDAGPCAYVYSDSPQAPGGFGDRGSQREERYRRSPTVRQGAELHGGASLGPWLRRVHHRVRVGESPPIHPRTGRSGWNRWTVLNP